MLLNQHIFVCVIMFRLSVDRQCSSQAYHVICKLGIVQGHSPVDSITNMYQQSVKLYYTVTFQMLHPVVTFDEKSEN